MVAVGDACFCGVLRDELLEADDVLTEPAVDDERAVARPCRHRCGWRRWWRGGVARLAWRWCGRCGGWGAADVAVLVFVADEELAGGDGLAALAAVCDPVDA